MSTSPDPRETTHEDLYILVSYMAENGATVEDIVYAVEKPWKHLDQLAEAKLDMAETHEWAADYESPKDAAESLAAAAERRAEAKALRS